MPTVQVIRISVNDAFTADPSLFDKLRESATKAGIVNQSFGFGVEEPTQLYWILRTRVCFVSRNMSNVTDDRLRPWFRTHGICLAHNRIR